MERNKRWMILCVSLLLFGCVTAQEAQVLVERTHGLSSQMKKLQKEDEVFKKELTDLQIFRKEIQKNISDIQNNLLALQTDLQRLQTNLFQRFESFQSQLNITIQKENESLRNELTAFQKTTQNSLSTLQKEDSLLKSDLSKETKRLQADLSLRLETLQSEIRTISTAMEEYKEYLKRSAKEIDRVKEESTTRTRILDERGKTFEERYKAQEERNKFFEERSKGIVDRLREMEDRLRTLDVRIDRVASKQVELDKPIPKEPLPEVKGLATGAKDLYNDAYETFKMGDIEGSRKKFEAFLKQYPNTDLSDNAQFWIGETYYLKKDFEKAILEYEKAIAKYPEGDKIPAALFKQALAFLELEDKTNARNLLKRVIERYPHSEQAEMAKKRLEAIK